LAERYDSIIIGAGFAGLSAGIRLAQFQERVLILESHFIPGGLNSYYYRGGKDKLYNTGLHTVTNFNAKNRRWGFGLICRNLGISAEDFELVPPSRPSLVEVPGANLIFDNDLETLRSSVRDRFPGEIDAFDRFCADLPAIEDVQRLFGISSRDWLETYFHDPVLLDLLELPVYIYGGYREGKIDAATFSTVFRSIFLEGCGSPPDIKHILDLLLKRFKHLGGELKMRKQVSRIDCEGGVFRAVELADGTRIEADRCLSSAGLLETGQLVGENWGKACQLSVFETVVSVEAPLAELQADYTLQLISQQDRFQWAAPAKRRQVDHLTLAASACYDFAQEPRAKHFKIGCFQKGDLWLGLDEETYQREKRLMEEQMLNLLLQRYPGLRDFPAEHCESLTPRTVVTYTRHHNGGIYGGSEKTFDGTTPVENLFVVGNDQGGIGIMGALTSGVIVSNFQVILK